MDQKKKTKSGEQEGESICNVFLVGIDGSEGSHNAVELVTTNFYRPGLDKIILVHITNLKKEQEKGVKYHSKTIYNKYHEYLQELKIKQDDYEMIFEDRKENENVFEQINDIAVAKSATLLVLGFRGYKGTKNRPDELSKSVTYLVHKPRIPVLVVKEKTSRKYRPNYQFKWLICLESAESKSFKAMKSMLRFVDSDNDIIYGLNIAPADQVEKDNNVKRVFEEQMKKFEIKNYQFNIITREDDKSVNELLTKWINNHISGDNHYLDFVVMGYNPIKYLFNKETSNTTVELLKNVTCNVYFDH